MPAAPSGNLGGFALGDFPVPLVHATHRIIRDCNAEFAELFGYERDELIEFSFSVLYPKLADFVHTGQMWRVNFAGGRLYADERIMRRRDGSRFWCRVRGRSRNAGDPFGDAIYSFGAMNRQVATAGPALTDRQRQIVSLVAQGKTNAVIAAETGLSKRTIEAHRARLMRAVGVRNGAQLIAWALGEAR